MFLDLWIGASLFFGVGLFIKILLLIFVFFDFLILWVFIDILLFISPGNELFGQGLLYDFDLHRVFVILIYVAIFALWNGIQQIAIFRIYLFKILACAINAFFVVALIVSGNMIGPVDIDLTWTIFIGIVYFVVLLAIRSRNSGLIKPKMIKHDYSNQPLPFYMQPNQQGYQQYEQSPPPPPHNIDALPLDQTQAQDQKPKQE